MGGLGRKNLGDVPKCNLHFGRLIMAIIPPPSFWEFGTLMDIFLERGGGGKNVTYDLQGSNLHFFGHPPSLKNTSFGTAGGVPTYIVRGTRGPPKNVTYIFSRPPLILRVKGVGIPKPLLSPGPFGPSDPAIRCIGTASPDASDPQWAQ